jgi:hypothetical protein
LDALLAELGAVLAVEYGVIATAFTPGPRGFVGETYIVDPADGPRLFAKILPPAPHVPRLIRSLPVLEELHALGLPVNRPLRTRAGDLAVPLGVRTLIVFDYISNQPNGRFGYDFAAFVDVLARVHAATPQIRSPLGREDFTLPWAADLETHWPAVMQAGTTAPGWVGDVARMFQPYQAQMKTDWATLQALTATCRVASWTPVLTHSDAPGDNVLTGLDGRVYLVDWDDVLLGPAERDTWFHLHAAQAPAFLAVYRQTFPAYQPDPQLYRFYLFRRFFEDLVGYLMVLAADPPPPQQARYLADLYETCFEWLWPLMREA